MSRLSRLAIAARASRRVIAHSYNYNYRPHLTKFLASERARTKANATALCLVSLVNRRLAADGVPLSYEHFDILRTSLLSGARTCEVLEKERQAVLNSTGQGRFYHAARRAHEMLAWFSSNG